MNPEGTPNPLNPVQGAQPVGPTAAGTGMLDYSEPITTVPSPSSSSTTSGQFTRPTTESSMNSFTRPTNTTSSSTDGFTRPAGFARPNGTAGVSGGFSRPASGIDGFTASRPAQSHAAVDPMMRPASHAPASEPYDSFESLGVSDFNNGLEESLSQVSGPSAQNPRMSGMAGMPNASRMPAGNPGFSNSAEPMPNLTAKDSIVEPAGGKKSKKKPLIIGAIVLAIIAVICGAAAIALAIVNNSGGDKVSKAVEKLLSGQVSSIISAEGNINLVPNGEDANEMVDSANIRFNGTFDTASLLNKVDATVTGDLSTGKDFTLDVSELTNKSGETFLKINGLDTILSAVMPSPSLTAPTVEVSSENATLEVDLTGTNATATTETTEVATTEDLTAVSGLMSIYSGLISAANNQWILVSDGFSSDMSELSMFDNPATCMIDSLSTLTGYASSVAKSYKENPFITYSTDKMTVSKKRNDLYRLTFDASKLEAFENSLNKTGLLDKLSGCAGDDESDLYNLSNGASIISVLNSLPTIYTEIDNDYNFTRFYFESDNVTLNGAGAVTVTADLNLSYPSELKITEPENYIPMSTLLSSVMSGIISGETDNAASE